MILTAQLTLDSVGSSRKTMSEMSASNCIISAHRLALLSNSCYKNHTLSISVELYTVVKIFMFNVHLYIYI